MSELYVYNKLSSPSIISGKVKTSSPLFENDNIVIIKLLSGKKVIQHIGEISQTIEISCIVSRVQKELLNETYRNGGMFLLKRYGENIVGYVSEPPTTEPFALSIHDNKRTWIMNFTLNVDGDL